MIDDGVLIFCAQAVVGFQFVAVESRASFHMLTHLLVQFASAAIVHDHGANVSAAFQHSHHNGFVFSACASDDASAFRAVHIPRFAANKSLVNLYFAAGSA